MRKPSFAIAPEGASALFLTSFSTLVFALLRWPVPALVCWLCTIFTLNFFRDPERVPPGETSVAASPADGKIISIGKCNDPFENTPRTRISVFMNVFNVHVNRAPVACQVEAIRYIPGAFFNASLDKASKDNERCLWRLKDLSGHEWTMVQIAGLIARRIVCRAEPGDNFAMGDRVGMIRFGSRVDLYLPEEYAPAVGIGDRVYAGETIIARKSG